MTKRAFLVRAAGALATALPFGRRAWAADSETFEISKTDEEWKGILSPTAFAVLREEDTERAGTSPLNKEHRPGTYRCAGCALPVFSSETKFESGTGWPSFWKPIDGAIRTRKEGIQNFVPGTEVHCRRCGGHLGHVFNDGPPPTRLRYCINGVALSFEPRTGTAKTERATFAAGCFWHVEAAFRKIDGVVEVTSGYTGGTVANPTYEQVCTDKTGHAESILIEFDPSRVSFDRLLDAFWHEHDPTTLNRQGWDVGTQYRSAIFYHSPAQRAAAVASKQRLEKSAKYKSPIVTQILPAAKFYRAEDEHQRYFEKHPEAEMGHANWPADTAAKP